MGGGKSGGGDTRVQFAEYIQEMHNAMLGTRVTSPLYNVAQAMNAAWRSNPYAGVTTVKAEDGFIGVGVTVGERTPLMTLFSMFMRDVDPKILWTQLYEDSVNSDQVTGAVVAQDALMQDEIDERIMPKFLAGSRDINAIHSSTFVIGKALLMDSKQKLIADFSAKLKLKQVDIAQARWEKHLNWNAAIVATYSDIMKLYYTAHFDSESRQLEYDVKEATWDLSIFEYGRSMLGALNGAAAATPRNEPSQAAKGIAGAMAGAGAGAMIGSQISDNGGAAYGAAAGGVLGLAASFL